MKTDLHAGALRPLAALALATVLALAPGCGGGKKGGGLGAPGATDASTDGGLPGGSTGLDGGVQLDAGPGLDAGGTDGGGGIGMAGGQADATLDTAGGGGPDAATPPADSAPAAPSPWVELTAPAIDLRGGTARSAGGQGQPGGTIQLVSAQDIVLDPARAPAPAPAIPAVPANAMTIASGTTDITSPGTAGIGDLATGGPEPVRAISASTGDLFVTGTLRSADQAARRQGLSLSAPAGTVYIAGAVDTSGADGSGQAGGAIHITARRVVIAGRVDSSGGDGVDAGGAAGTITITAAEVIAVTGGLDAAGGNARGAGAVAGGKAGDVVLEAGGDLILAGHSRLRGGAAEGLGAGARGGAAATLLVRADGSVQIGGILDIRSGLATATTAGGQVVGGAAGALKVGEIGGRTPSSIAILGPVNAAGGEGEASGGKGGAFRAEPLTGNVIVRGARAIDVSGGDATGNPGEGGTVFASGRSESSSAGVDVQGEILVDGGSVRAGGSGPGAAAGRIDVLLTPIRGAIQIGASGKLSAVGGRSGGAAVAGGGGHVWLFTNDGDVTLAGTIAAMGGDAPDAGGTGGLGGMVILWSDHNGNADEVADGNLLIAPTGRIDVSGGNGTIGGSARSDGIADSVAAFPEDEEMIAIRLDCDNVDGPSLNWLENKGQLFARGGSNNGNGGDILFHGILPNGEEPEPGNVDVAGHGTGSSGDFGSD